MEPTERLLGLFGQIESEFTALRLENAALRERVAILQAALADRGIFEEPVSGIPDVTPDQQAKVPKAAAKQNLSQRIEQAYRISTNKLARARFLFDQFDGEVDHAFTGHTDGVWEVTSCSTQPDVIGTASADRTVRFWSGESAQCLGIYTGHTGSVNSVRFHPTHPRVCSASGDGTVHIYHLPAPDLAGAPPRASPDGLSPFEGDGTRTIVVRTPQAVLTGHTDVVAAADWVNGGESIVSGSWDRLVQLWDVETGKVSLRLTGHSQEITNVSVHAAKRFIVSSSRDETFRLWDFRQAPIHEVNVFQGHSAAVNTAVFAGGDSIVSGSDDKTMKYWDLRNMRAPVQTVRLDGAPNRLCVSPKSSIVAVPLDNRVKLFDMTGNRLVRLPRRGKLGHKRMVASATWGADDVLYTAGFDSLVYVWSISERRKAQSLLET